MRSFVQAGLVVTAIFAVACKGPAGATGPQGAQGTQGVQGVQGPTGPTGNANIISGVDTVTDADWSTSTVQEYYAVVGGAYGSKPARYLDFAVPQLTGTTYSEGAVLVWMNVPLLSATEGFVQLPWHFLFLSASVEYHYDLNITPGRIRVLFFVQNLANPADFGDPMSVGQGTRVYHWVVIPPAASSLVADLQHEPSPAAAIASLQAHGFVVSPNGAR